MQLEIKKIGINGEGIGYYRRKPVFIAGCLPGEQVAVGKLNDWGRYYTAEIKNIVQKSEGRVTPRCREYPGCDGCAFIYLDYRRQLEYKKELLREALHKYAGYKGPIEEVVGADKILGYRNKLSLPVTEDDGKLINAMYAAGSNKMQTIRKCAVHDEKLEKIRRQILNICQKNGIKAYDRKLKKGLRQLTLRIMDEHIQVALTTGEEEIPEPVIKEIMALEGVMSLYQGINTERNPLHVTSGKTRLLAGHDESISFMGYKLKLHPQAFFQLNTAQAEKLYELVRSMINPAARTVVEAYSGIGVMSMLVAEKAEKVYAIEIEKEAVTNGRENAAANRLDNIEFICGDAVREFRKLKQQADCLIVDPPRSGLDERLVEAIMEVKPKQIIYVSCNPATLGRNLNTLKEAYHIEKIIPLDMFPQTPHCESITVLQKK